MYIRSKEEMIKEILDFANQHEEIRTVYLTGSRANPNAPEDIFQDYDIVYGVNSTFSFLEDKTWIAEFGEVTVMQEPDNPVLFEAQNDSAVKYTYLVQFADINRIDFTFLRMEYIQEDVKKHAYVKLLLDKDSMFSGRNTWKNEKYRLTKPTEGMYYGCVNEFHWVSTYLAKGLWRGELLYVMEHLNGAVRPQLLKMLIWQVGFETDFSADVGKCCKYIANYLPKQTWQKYLSTFVSADTEILWNTLLAMQDFFTEIAVEVGKQMQCEYPREEAVQTRLYLEQVRKMSS